MSEYKIFTDSSANLTNDIINEYNLGIITLSFISNGIAMQSYEKDSNKNLKKFYEILRKKENLTTTCANISDFVSEFEPCLKEGLDIIYIGFSSGLSSTFESSKQAADILSKSYPARRILCVDSLNASLGEGLLVYSACIQKQCGMDINELYDYLNNNKMNINSIFTVKTLSYLARGGRISKLNYALGTVVDVKPIMAVNENGKLIATQKVIGRKRSISTIAEKVSKMIINPEEQTIFISHGDCIEDAEYLASLISQKIKVKDFVYNYIDPVVGVHSGPDTLAVFFYGISRLPSPSKVQSKSLANNEF